MARARTYIGPLGMLQEGTEWGVADLKTARKTSRFEGADGTSVLFAAPSILRTWSVSIPYAYTHEVAFMSQVASLARPVSVAFVPPEAPTTNVFPLAVTGLRSSLVVNGKVGGPTQLGDQWFGASVLTSPAASLELGRGHGAPVLAGSPVMGSIYVDSPADAQVTVAFRTPTGGVVQPTATVTRGASGNRAWCLTTVPVGAAYAMLIATGVSVAAGPCITWTSGLLAYSEGRGCFSAYVSPLDFGSPIVGTTTAGYQAMQDVSFSVEEVLA